MMPEGQARGESATPVDILRLTPIFRLLSDSEVSELGAGLRHLSFAPGELIIRQGDDGDSMYFVTSGTGRNHLSGRGPRRAPGSTHGSRAIFSAKCLCLPVRCAAPMPSP